MSLAFKEQLSRVILDQVSLHDLQITAKCEHKLEKFVGIGIEKMVISKMADRFDKKILAEQNLIRFLELMQDHAKEEGCYPVIDDEEFDTVKIDCGPLWPFLSSGF